MFDGFSWNVVNILGYFLKHIKVGKLGVCLAEKSCCEDGWWPRDSPGVSAPAAQHPHPARGLVSDTGEAGWGHWGSMYCGSVRSCAVFESTELREPWWCQDSWIPAALRPLRLWSSEVTWFCLHHPALPASRHKHTKIPFFQDVNVQKQLYGCLFVVICNRMFMFITWFKQNLSVGRISFLH